MTIAIILAEAKAEATSDHWQWYAAIAVSLITTVGVVLSALIARNNGKKINTLTEKNTEDHGRVAEALQGLAVTVSEMHSTVSLFARTDGRGYFKMDAQGMCLDVNAAYEKITGLSLPDALGDGWRGALHPDDRHRVESLWARAIIDKAQFGPTEYRFVAGGEDRPVSVTALPIRDALGEVEGWVGVVIAQGTGSRY